MAVSSNSEGQYSEFAIKYCHSRESARLNPIGRKLMAPTKSADEKLDVIACIIHCAKHENMAVYQDPKSGIQWFPFSPIMIDKTWTDSAVIGALQTLCDNDLQQFEQLQAKPPFADVRLLETLRVQMPQTLDFLTRMIFYMKLDSKAKNFDCCRKTSSIIWASQQDLTSNKISNLWGPEVAYYWSEVVPNFATFIEQIEEFSLDDVYFYLPRDPPRNAEESMLSELKISEKTIEILYNDFLDHCWPSVYMPFNSFKRYLGKYGIRADDARLEQLFAAINFSKTGTINFHELLMGLVCLEPNAPHQETRFMFIFRYYDAGSKGFLEKKDFCRIVADLECTGEPEQSKVTQMFEDVGVTTKNGKEMVTFATFREAILMQRLRGTSKLCRSRVHVFLQLTRAFIRRKKPSDGIEEWKDLKAVVVPRQHKGRSCGKCRHTFQLATHAVSFGSDGYIAKPVRLKDKDKTLSVDKHSVEFVFNSKSISNVLMEMIRDFAIRKGTVAKPRGLLDGGPKDHEKMLYLLEQLVGQAKEVFREESRLAEVESPCYVVGDIHGNLEDLLTIEKALWRAVPCLNCNFLFLGDYVDRGKWGFECAVYLIAMKLLDRAHVTLLRGNHEVRPLQEKYSYKAECLIKYGAYGERIWSATNEIFDLLPVAAIVDNTIFCTHGGLSPNAQTLDQIRSVPAVIDNPEQQSKIAWELLWSDPVSMNQYFDIVDFNELSTAADLAKDGYLFNAKRGAAYLFNENAAAAFLKRNGLTHMIRAHEVHPDGFAHHFKDMVTTVFSCSHYCNNANKAAVILVDDCTIRVINIDTANNAPATDQ